MSGRTNAGSESVAGDGKQRSAVRANHARAQDPETAGTGHRDHFRRPYEAPFTRAERERVTVLLGGLTARHDRFMRAALQGTGYRAEVVATPTRADFQAGREYGNNGQCNPTHFGVGALINHLRHLRDEHGLTVERIVADHVFVTAGSCGPCRFGMYEAEYRLGLRNAGFDGFRVLVIDQTGNLLQGGEEAGFDVNASLVSALLSAILMGDLLTALAYHVRPYETVPGRTDGALEHCLEICEAALRTGGGRGSGSGWAAMLALPILRAGFGSENAAAMVDQLFGDRYIAALLRCRDIVESHVEVDYTRPRPVVKITGEFWAQTTEGDGNFNMFRFLESEGAEVLVEPVATWFDYCLSYAGQYIRDRRGLDERGAPPHRLNVVRRLRREAAYRKAMLGVRFGRWAFARIHERMRVALGGSVHRLANQVDLQRLGHPYYNSRSAGGEGHLEVAKNIYYCTRQLAHMVLSLKPFGCMPSTQSDGAQAAVLAHYPEMLFLPLETSGDGEIGAHSRVQMTLGEAKVRCRAEFQAALERSGYSISEIRAFVAARTDLRRPLQPVPRKPGIVGRSANFILHVADLMNRDPAMARRRMTPPATREA